MYSEFLRSRHLLCRELIDRLKDKFPYVSILGKQIEGNLVTVTTSSIMVKDTPEQQCGFVVKLFNGYTYSEYSFTDITENTIDEIEKQVLAAGAISDHLKTQCSGMGIIPDTPLNANYVREMEGKKYTVPEIIQKLSAMKDHLHAYSPKIMQAILRFEYYEVSAMFLSPNRDLTQNYSWSSIMGAALARDEENLQQSREISAWNNQEKCFAEMRTMLDGIAQLALDLLKAENIKPGYYDIITEPSITGLIAHEAFGHGVEMDMFVKNRAMSRHYIHKPVASPLVNMHDGAAAVESCIGYFFDDDGVPAHDTLIIKEGILQTGISDAVSAMQLGTAPTGNGRRQDPAHKAYTRMTNTFFGPGKDKVEDMIASVKYGYMLCSTDNGMEDPKNWNIQCVAQYGREIRDGKFTGKIVAPVVMSGYVPDLLKSISMVSDEWKVIGSGHCGKGYKEWIPVSDGGPYLKAKCKLG